MKRIASSRAAALAAMVLAVGPLAAAQNAGIPPEALSDAWWTGPLLAPNAATLPRGHFYFEPYLYDSMPYAEFDAQGRAHPAPYQNVFGSLSYLNYGLTDRVTIGMIPRFGYVKSADGPSSSGPGVGDLTLQAQYRLTPIEPHSRIPIASINVQETLPLGRYDRLDRISDGFGSGAVTTTLSTYFMWYFWLPTGRILRTRLDLSYAFASRVALADVSVYGTPRGFRGHAQPGDTVFGDLAFEYSLTRNWVLACDFWAERDGNTRVSGTIAGPGPALSFASDTGVGRVLYAAPALEYNWTSRLGVILGARVVAVARNETGTVTPVAAISYFH